MINFDKNGFASARELHQTLEVPRDYSTWIKDVLSYDFEKGKDFNFHETEEVRKEGNRMVKRSFKDVLMNSNMAKEVAMISKAPKSKEVRQYLISLDNQKQDGLLLSHSDITDIVTLTNACYEEKFRELARKKHINTYLPNNPEGYHYGKAQLKRNLVCGINRNDIEKRLNEINKKFESIEKALINVDKHELIRISVIDVMIFFGKTTEYAINVGNLAKELSKKQSSSFTSKNSMFPLPQELEKLHLQLNK